MNYETLFAESLRRLRKSAGMTQKELAEATGYSEKTISKWECAASIPDISGLFALSRQLHVQIEELFADEEKTYFLGIDGGGTKTSLVLADSEGEILRTLQTDNCNPFDIGMEDAQVVLREAIDEICGEIPKSCVVMYAGIAGGSSGNMKQVFHDFFQSFHFRMFENDSDNYNLLEAGLGDGDGMALILGTGICAWSRRAGVCSRVSGWGYLIDRGGSAYNLGQDALYAYYCAEDGVNDFSPLSEAVKKRCPEGKQALLPRIYDGGKKYIASFADLVFEALEAGDPLAEEILSRNMQVAACAIETAGKRFAEDPGPIKVILAGGLTKQPSVFAYLKKSLKNPERFMLQVLEKEPMYGAVALAKRLWEQQHS